MNTNAYLTYAGANHKADRQTDKHQDWHCIQCWKCFQECSLHSGQIYSVFVSICMYLYVHCILKRTPTLTLLTTSTHNTPSTLHTPSTTTPPQPTTQASLSEWPVMKSLLTVLKQLLKDQHLNEVYSGGVSSYSLTLLILFFLKVARISFIVYLKIM